MRFFVLACAIVLFPVCLFGQEPKDDTVTFGAVTFPEGQARVVERLLTVVQKARQAGQERIVRSGLRHVVRGTVTSSNEHGITGLDCQVVQLRRVDSGVWTNLKTHGEKFIFTVQDGELNAKAEDGVDVPDEVKPELEQTVGAALKRDLGRHLFSNQTLKPASWVFQFKSGGEPGAADQYAALIAEKIFYPQLQPVIQSMSIWFDRVEGDVARFNVEGDMQSPDAAAPERVATYKGSIHVRIVDAQVTLVDVRVTDEATLGAVAWTGTQRFIERLQVFEKDEVSCVFAPMSTNGGGHSTMSAWLADSNDRFDDKGVKTNVRSGVYEAKVRGDFSGDAPIATIDSWTENGEAGPEGLAGSTFSMGDYWHVLAGDGSKLEDSIAQRARTVVPLCLKLPALADALSGQTVRKGEVIGLEFYGDLLNTILKPFNSALLPEEEAFGATAMLTELKDGPNGQVAVFEIDVTLRKGASVSDRLTGTLTMDPRRCAAVSSNLVHSDGPREGAVDDFVLTLRQKVEWTYEAPQK